MDVLHGLVTAAEETVALGLLSNPVTVSAEQSPHCHVSCLAVWGCWSGRRGPGGAESAATRDISASQTRSAAAGGDSALELL